jgi:ankyrin repeat protein
VLKFARSITAVTAPRRPAPGEPDPRLDGFRMLLAARSVDVNAQDHAGNTALHLLAANRYADSQGRRVQCARWLVEAGGDVGVTDLQGRTAAELLRE